MHSFKKFFAFVLTGTFLFGELSSSVYAARKSGNSGNTKKVQKGRKASVRGAGNKRTASNRRSLKSGSSSVSSASVSVSSDGASAQEVTCRNAYVECMDIQINSLLGKYSYLSDDAAVDVLKDTGEPFRCMYYFEEDANENVKKISNDEDFEGKEEWINLQLTS